MTHDVEMRYLISKWRTPASTRYAKCLICRKDFDSHKAEEVSCLIDGMGRVDCYMCPHCESTLRPDELRAPDSFYMDESNGEK